MNAELALAKQPLAEQWRYAQALAQAGLLPRQYRDSPGDVLLAMAYADSLNIPVAQIFTGIHVIEGKPSMSAELMGALVRRAGHRIRMTGDATKAAAEIVRADDPTFTYRSSFTLDDAQRAGLLGKDVWKKYPAAMLLARAVSAVCRAGAADVLAGVSYVPEELGDVPDWIEEGSITIEPAPVAQDAENTAEVVEQPSEPAPEAPKRKRRTRAEIDADERANRQMHENVHQAVNEHWEGKQQEGAQEIKDAAEQWEANWLIDLEQAIDTKDFAALGVLGSHAAQVMRPDLRELAKKAWTELRKDNPGVADPPEAS